MWVNLFQAAMKHAHFATSILNISNYKYVQLINKVCIVVNKIVQTCYRYCVLYLSNGVQTYFQFEGSVQRLGECILAKFCIKIAELDSNTRWPMSRLIYSVKHEYVLTKSCSLVHYETVPVFVSLIMVLRKAYVAS